jgi:hypothetical protein
MKTQSKSNETELAQLQTVVRDKYGQAALRAKPRAFPPRRCSRR